MLDRQRRQTDVLEMVLRISSSNLRPGAHGTLRRRAVLWHRLRGIGNPTPAKLTVIIPLIGYLILFNDKIQDWLRLVS
jgi:hypothetical protein